jgi:hypothetical protein
MEGTPGLQPTWEEELEFARDVFFGEGDWGVLFPCTKGSGETGEKRRNREDPGCAPPPAVRPSQSTEPARSRLVLFPSGRVGDGAVVVVLKALFGFCRAADRCWKRAHVGLGCRASLGRTATVGACPAKEREKKKAKEYIVG